jgi:hypothetical protein
MALRVEQSHEHIKEGIEPTERFKYHWEISVDWLLLSLMTKYTVMYHKYLTSGTISHASHFSYLRS